MSAPTLEAILAKMRELAGDPGNEIVLAPPINPGSMTWLKERFETKLERPLPADLAGGRRCPARSALAPLHNP